MLTKVQILQKKETLTAKNFKSETLGGEVRFKKMMADGHYAIEAMCFLGNQEGERLAWFKQAAIAFSMVDEEDNLVWDASDIKGELSNFSRDVIDELFGFYQEMNPARAEQEEVKESLEKNR